MRRVRAIAFLRHFFFPHARKTYALLLSIFVSTHYVSYGAVLHNMAAFGFFDKTRYLFGAFLSTKAVTILLLLSICYFAISLVLDLLKELPSISGRKIQHA